MRLLHYGSSPGILTDPAYVSSCRCVYRSASAGGAGEAVGTVRQAAASRSRKKTHEEMSGDIIHHTTVIMRSFYIAVAKSIHTPARRWSCDLGGGRGFRVQGLAWRGVDDCGCTCACLVQHSLRHAPHTLHAWSWALACAVADVVHCQVTYPHSTNRWI